MEGPALNKIKAENLAEYYVIDKHINAVRYFLPVKLSPFCLNCHGDPALSEEIWGLPDGKDPTGATMENWKSGEIHGAFEVIQSLDQADKKFQGHLIETAIILIIAIAIASLVFVFVARSITQPIKKVWTLLAACQPEI